MAKLLNAVEPGAPWPDQVLIANACVVPKSPVQDPDDALGLRVLTVLPTLYRKLASIRNRQLESWCEGWSGPAIFAGVAGQGATQAWWSTAARAEATGANELDYAAGAVDIYKCHDQVCQHLLLLLLAAAGLPPQLLSAYSRFHEQLALRAVVGPGLGPVFHKVRGSAHGCAF